MKSAALCVLLILSLLCHTSYSASVMGKEMTNSADHLIQSQMEESNILAPLLRTKRQSHLSICTFCCKNKGCKFCCRT
ncbi:hepcidin-1 [Bombina bombina]|uniref:hepcidin-1 n=1 Tax=Bombina bombina TaxID=8345 RepID=UPI00235B224E|nr:hepcidin-1 [Bombina bombina]